MWAQACLMTCSQYENYVPGQENHKCSAYISIEDFALPAKRKTYNGISQWTIFGVHTRANSL